MENVVNTGAGALVHLSSGLDVLVLSDISKEFKFVGTDGVHLMRYSLDDKSRFCTSDESDAVLKKLKENGVFFCYECFELEPCYTTQEEVERRVGKKNNADDIQKCIEDFFEKISKLMNNEG